ncbi:MAG: peptide MFS transporter [Proteobacteria bacterium]|nr:peptide MFS transporter [Pseudomonadota bacterium]
MNQPRIGGHPAGLLVVILTGMWEVFALFGMRSVLVFYLTQDLAFSPVSAIQVYSLSTSAAMAMSLVGGVVADRWLGVQRAVICGALGMAAGHLLLVVPQLLFPALALLTVSNGLFKPSLVAQMNRLYDTNEPARDRAFTLYKAGCNGAAIFAPIVTGIVGTAWSWSAALALCGIGMVISSVIFLACRRYLVEADFRGAAGIDRGSAPQNRAALIAQLALVLLGAVLFWTAHGQQGGTIALWAESAVDRRITVGGAGLYIPAAWFQSVNPIIIVCCTPLINWWWARRGGASGAAGELRKLRTGAILLTVSFVIVAIAAQMYTTPVPSAWLFIALFFLTVGELYFDAIGQAFLLRFASVRSMTMFVSLWFVTLAAGFAGAGVLAQLWGRVPTPWYFAGVAVLAAAAAVAIIIAGRKQTLGARMP